MYSKEIEELYNAINGDKSRILSMCAGLENSIEILISSYFTLGNNDYQDFIEIIFADDTELSFSKKIKMLERFLNKIFPDYLKNKPDFIQKLNRVRKLRNKFAHSINLKPEELQPFLGKHYFKLGFIEDGLSKEETVSFDDILARANEVETLLYEIDELNEKVDEAARQKFNNFLDKLSSLSENPNSENS